MFYGNKNEMNGCQLLRAEELKMDLAWCEDYCTEQGYPSRGSTYDMLAGEFIDGYWEDFDDIATYRDVSKSEVC